MLSWMSQLCHLGLGSLVDSNCLIQRLNLQETCLVPTSPFDIDAPSVFYGLASEHGVEGIHNLAAVSWWQFLNVLQTVHLPRNSVIPYCKYDIKMRKAWSRQFLKPGYSFKKFLLGKGRLFMVLTVLSKLGHWSSFISQTFFIFICLMMETLKSADITACSML